MLPPLPAPPLTIIRCDDWGAQAATSAIQSLPRAPTMIVVHHTASANSQDMSRTHAISLARNIQQGHFARGWSDSGQHFTVSRGGYILEGRHGSYEAMMGGTSHIMGAHTHGKNESSVGIESEGNYMSVEPTSELWSSLASLCATICRYYGIPAEQIYGHRDFNATQCCGDKLYSRLDELRRLVKSLLYVRCEVKDWF